MPDTLMETQTPPVIVLHPEDSVAIARRAVPAGTVLPGGIVTTSVIAPGHKIARRAHAPGDKVLRYGQIIGFASAAIAPGEHVHEHNLALGTFDRDHAIGADRAPRAPHVTGKGFLGYRRADGRVGTRNYIGILTTVNCSAHVALSVARAFERNERAGYDPLAAYPNVDGVVALTHKTGCGMSAGEPLQLLRRTIEGYARHPNFSHVLVVGLGCEVNQVGGLFDGGNPALRRITVQGEGGTRKTIERAIADVEAVLAEANRIEREWVPASELKVALICGGSDGYSGITSNPALGAASDLIVRHGGTVILSETPETFGAEHLLTRRAATQAVGERLIERIKWWEAYGASQGVSLNANPTPGNKAGGLTTIVEKSLGAIAKAGRTNLEQVVEYAEPVTSRGLVFMDGPGYDPVQVTGQIASGANLVAFTTGRGSVFGSKPVPTLKLASNSAMYRHMAEDMDINCGTILDGEESIDQCGERIFQQLLALAGGAASKSEALDFGAPEFAPWVIGPVI
ncbi:altronate dehydratase family protein [Frigidibacter sp. MR17.14]|uniref:UxaA family hydrolase n=1 Tax=Frigidibacter sp. MR17.14 TaxID=3126509 RepID=UPI003012CB7A